MIYHRLKSTYLFHVVVELDCVINQQVSLPRDAVLCHLALFSKASKFYFYCLAINCCIISNKRFFSLTYLLSLFLFLFAYGSSIALCFAMPIDLCINIDKISSDEDSESVHVV